jgi:hypothetical protein
MFGTFDMDNIYFLRPYLENYNCTPATDYDLEHSDLSKIIEISIIENFIDKINYACL